MKTLKSIAFIIFAIIITACSNDDDTSSNSEQAYFPTQIETLSEPACTERSRSVKVQENKNPQFS